MKIEARVIADSKNRYGGRVTTMLVTMPRIILAEFNTHRAFSRNSASSRAIPFEKMVKSVEENPFIPIAWQKDHKGMQGNEYLNDEEVIDFGFSQKMTLSKAATKSWLEARDNSVRWAKVLHNDKLQVTKQLCNRLLEPFMWHTVLVTSTEWENFFALRCPQYEQGSQIFRSRKDVIKYVKDSTEKELGSGNWLGECGAYHAHNGSVAHPHLPNSANTLEWLKLNKGQAEIHMMALAEAMYDAYNESIPKQLEVGEWHIPFGDNMPGLEDFVCDLSGNEFDPTDGGLEYNYAIETAKLKVSVARCARTSYTVVGEENKNDYSKDIALFEILKSNGHASPFEHIAQVMDEYTYNLYPGSLGKSRNFTGGWFQYRQILGL